MDLQPKYKPQSASQFFADSSAQRIPVAGTVPRGQLRQNDQYYKGIDSRSSFLGEMPVAITMQLLERGRERYNIYCSPCHSRVGDGKGIIIGRGYPPPPSFHEDRIIELSDGHIFDVISHGIRNMPAYNHQVPVDDRWAIVAYLRALQRSQKASLQDVPPEMRQKIREVK
jgi:mono/diheme cytochrome c family protein